VSLVVDASVAAKWVLPEPESDRAEQLWTSGEALIAPALVVAEIGNAVWKRAARGELGTADALRALEDAVLLFHEIAPMTPLAARATEMAIELRHPVYDCFYLALAERERATIVSADSRLLAAAKRLKRVKARRL
jgi:predicted nucleic acid-binding protein